MVLGSTKVITHERIERAENARHVRVCRRLRPEKTIIVGISIVHREDPDLADAHRVSVHIPSSTDAILLLVDGKIEVLNFLSEASDRQYNYGGGSTR